MISGPEFLKVWIRRLEISRPLRLDAREGTYYMFLLTCRVSRMYPVNCCSGRKLGDVLNHQLTVTEHLNIPKLTSISLPE